ncbi:alpha-(1,3)-fucosyltransferase fut-5-like [Ruditapes philippinarum]|uniref:alpha-(1,3)-fucosyltransferase fut-5-like n=1 Tax=Ruditapes philippinarum TaxID=129788 RepID=UPI00295BED05|nr:alpha-(1,3)-fucosyltransferase fut-5-like [Ruditapes philippinarum]
MTEYQNHTRQSDALVFNSKEELPSNISSVFKYRSSDQVWVFFQMEPPSRISTFWFRDEMFRNSFNWSWSYRLNADIFRPIRTLQRRIGNSNLDYKAIYRRKTKMAAWVVSHCNTQSLREEYVSSLIKAGIDVDIFGGCSHDRKRENASYIMKTISQEYKFYLAFENSFCEDYITEKFFTYYGLDVILIVRGGFKYANFFDKSTFIDTSDFESVKELAGFLMNVSSREEVYTSYLKNKDKYIPGYTQWDTIQHSSCQLCSKLNNINRYLNIYNDISISVANDTCYEPTDNN